MPPHPAVRVTVPMISPLPSSSFRTSPFVSARVLLNLHGDIAGFPVLSLVLSSGSTRLAAAALVTKVDRVSGGTAWAAEEEQAHIWSSDYEGGVSQAELRTLYAVLSAVSPLQNVSAVAHVGSALSIAPRGRFVASRMAESPWGVCMMRREEGSAVADPAREKPLWRYDVTFFVLLGTAAADDATFALDRASPRVLHALEMATELAEERGLNRTRILRRLAEEGVAGVGGIVGPPERMRTLLEVSGAVAAASSTRASGAPSTVVDLRPPHPSAPAVVDLVSSDDDEDGEGAGRGPASGGAASSDAAAGRGGPAPSAAAAAVTADVAPTVSSVIDSLVPDVVTADAALHPAVRALNMTVAPSGAAAALKMHGYQRSAVQWMLDRELSSEHQRLRVQRRAQQQREAAAAAAAAGPDDDGDVPLPPLLASVDAGGGVAASSLVPDWLGRLATIAQERYGPVLTRLGPGVGLGRIGAAAAFRKPGTAGLSAAAAGSGAAAAVAAAAAPEADTKRRRTGTRLAKAEALKQLAGSEDDTDDAAASLATRVPLSVAAEALTERLADIREEARGYRFEFSSGGGVSHPGRIPEYTQPLPWMSDAPIVRAARHPLWQALNAIEVDPGSTDALAALLSTEAGKASVAAARTAALRSGPHDGDERLVDAATVARLRFWPCCTFHFCAATSRIIREPCRDCAAAEGPGADVRPLACAGVELRSGKTVAGVDGAIAAALTTDFDGVARGGMLCDEMGLGKVRHWGLPVGQERSGPTSTPFPSTP